MWFRRKKKVDPDSALTETLRSLQVLLEDDQGSIEQTKAKQPKSTVNTPDPQTTQTETNPDLPNQQTPPDEPPLPPANEKATAITAESSVHATSADPVNPKITDNETTSAVSAQVPEVDNTPNVIDPPTSVDKEQQEAEESLLTPFGSPDNHESKEESTWIDPFRQEDDPPVTEDLVLELDSEDLADQDVEVPVIDTIPVLTDVVFEPVTPAANVAKTDTVDREVLLEVCVNDLRERLRQNSLTQMDGEQEERLRQILTYILGNKSTSHTE